MFWFVWFLWVTLNFFLLREILKTLREKMDIDLEEGWAVGFWIAVIASLIPAFNIIVSFIMLVLFLLVKWIERKWNDETISHVTFSLFIDDIFGLNKKPKRKEE